MICTLCAHAADQHAPADQHCTDPKCMCGHRVDRYRPRWSDLYPPVSLDGQALSRLVAAPHAATAEQCRAEFHHPNMQSARCDLPADHPDLHREQPDPSRVAFRWDDLVAMYPTDTTKD